MDADVALKRAPVTQATVAAQGLVIEIGGARVVDDVSFAVGPGETLGIVGESGCGKTLTALALLRLLPPAARLAAGSVTFQGNRIDTLDRDSLRRLRGDRIAMIFQEPMTALNPVFTVGEQIAEPLMAHRAMARTAALTRARDLLDLVGIAPAAAARYPHQLSGGQRQRVMIAMALACEPALLVADEPTTALDVTVQAEVLELMRDLRRRFGMAMILITHDLGVVAETCDRVAVMYAGRIVEEGPATEVFAAPRHRYTRALLDTIPARNPPGRKLPFIPGLVPRAGERPPGCAFRARCAAPVPACARERPELTGDGHRYACWNPA